MGEKAKTMGRWQAAEEIVEECYRLVEEKKESNEMKVQGQGSMEKPSNDTPCTLYSSTSWFESPESYI